MEFVRFSFRVGLLSYQLFVFHLFVLMFLPNIIKIDPYNFELYRFKVDALF